MYPAGKVAEKEGEGRVKGKRLLSAAMLLPLLLTACGERPGECEGEMEGKRDGAPEWLTDRWRVEHKEERLRLDIAIPQVGEELAGAAELNARIEADYIYYLDRRPEEYGICDVGFADPSIHIWYELYQWGETAELCIFGREESLMGSGPVLWTDVYGYDLEEDILLTAEELLERLGYTSQDVVEGFYKEIVEPEDPESYTWENIRDGWFYVNEMGKLAFTVSLYG